MAIFSHIRSIAIRGCIRRRVRRGQSLCWLDTPGAGKRCCNAGKTFSDMGLTAKDRFFFPFSFGPFIGFWSAFEAASRAGFLCIPGRRHDQHGPLRFLQDHAATVVCCTPTYALHLSELAAHEGIDLASSDVRAIIVAGEPGGAIPSTRQRIESVWGARVFDHYGMTEVGPVAWRWCKRRSAWRCCKITTSPRSSIRRGQPPCPGRNWASWSSRTWAARARR